MDGTKTGTGTRTGTGIFGKKTLMKKTKTGGLTRGYIVQVTWKLNQKWI